MDDYSKKLNDLRAIYTQPKDLKKLSDQEKKLRKLIISQELSEDHVIKKIIADAKKDVENIDFLLCNDEKFNEPGMAMERRMLFEKKKWIKHDIIHRFSMEDAKAAQQLIESSIDKTIKRS